MGDETIYHLALASELRAGREGDAYLPPRFADDGFVHCAARDVVLSVADDYFSDAPEPVWLLELDCTQLSAEVRWEAPAPIAGGGTVHLRRATTFPHVYGAIELAAVRAVGELGKTDEGFAWPARMVALGDVLAEVLG